MRLPFTQESDFRQERDFGQKISATIEFIAAHWHPLGRVMLYLVLPAAMLRSIFSILIKRLLPIDLHEMRRVPGIGAAKVLGMQKAMWSTFFVSPAYWLSHLLGTAFFALLVLSIYGYVVLLLHRSTPGPEVTVAEVWAGVRQRFIRTSFASWGILVLTVIGLAFLLVPGIYLSVALSLFFIVQLSEGTGFFPTISRCLYLMRGKWWSTFALIFIVIVLFYIILVGIGAVASYLAGGFVALLRANREQAPLFTIVYTIFESLLLLLLYPPLLLALAFQYFNLVERKEGVGMRRLVGSLGQTAAPMASNAAYQPNEEGDY